MMRCDGRDKVSGCSCLSSRVRHVGGVLPAHVAGCPTGHDFYLTRSSSFFLSTLSLSPQPTVLNLTNPAGFSRLQRVDILIIFKRHLPTHDALISSLSSQRWSLAFNNQAPQLRSSSHRTDAQYRFLSLFLFLFSFSTLSRKPFFLSHGTCQEITTDLHPRPRGGFGLVLEEILPQNETRQYPSSQPAAISLL